MAIKKIIVRRVLDDDITVGFMYRGVYFYQFDFRTTKFMVTDEQGYKYLYCDKSIDRMTDSELDEYVHLLHGIRRGYKHCLLDPRNSTPEREAEREKFFKARMETRRKQAELEAEERKRRIEERQRQRAKMIEREKLRLATQAQKR